MEQELQRLSFREGFFGSFSGQHLVWASQHTGTSDTSMSLQSGTLASSFPKFLSRGSAYPEAFLPTLKLDQ